MTYIEDSVIEQISYSRHRFFPSHLSAGKKWKVYLISILHILGIAYMLVGVLSPPRLLPWYVGYLVLLLILYHKYNHKCFLTVWSSRYTSKADNPIRVRMLLVYIIIGCNLITSLLGMIAPQFSPYQLFRSSLFVADTIMTSLIRLSPVSGILPLGLLVASYLLFRVTSLK